MEIGRSLYDNKSLTYLNLEYNGFGTEGAEEIGDPQRRLEMPPIVFNIW